MVKIENYLDKSMVSKLTKIGLSEENISDEIDKLILDAKKRFGDKYESFMKRKCQVYFSGKTTDGKVLVKGIVIGVSHPTNTYELNRLVANKKVGELCAAYDEKLKKNHPTNKYTIKADCFAYGYQQGQPIPTTPFWERKALVLVENGDKIIETEVAFQGDWTTKKDSNLTKLSIIKMKVAADKVGDNKLSISDKVLLESNITVDIATELIEEHSKDSFRTFEELHNMTEFSGNYIVKDVENISISGNRFTLGDVANETLDPELCFQIYNNNNELDIDFVEGAMGMTLICSGYHSPTTNKTVIKVVSLLVPENMKAELIPAEDLEAAAEAAASDFGEETTGTEEVDLGEDIEDGTEAVNEASGIAETPKVKVVAPVVEKATSEEEDDLL
jgi:hypothetical protein